MYKLIGALIIILVFTLGGISKAFALKIRIKNLNQFRNLFEDLKFEINLKSTELPDAVKRIGKKYNNECFINWSSLMESSGAEPAFYQSLESQLPRYRLNKNDTGVIKCIVASLGRLDMESQISRLDCGIASLDKYINEVTGMCNEKTRLYVTGSVLLGVFTVILFI